MDISEKQEKKTDQQKVQKYGTWIENISGMTCFFVGCYKNGKFPICNIGPSKLPMLCNLVFCAFVLAYFLFMVNMFAKNNGQKYIAYFSVFVNLNNVFPPVLRLLVSRSTSWLECTGWLVLSCVDFMWADRVRRNSKH